MPLQTPLMTESGHLCPDVSLYQASYWAVRTFSLLCLMKCSYLISNLHLWLDPGGKTSLSEQLIPSVPWVLLHFKLS